MVDEADFKDEPTALDNLPAPAQVRKLANDGFTPLLQPFHMGRHITDPVSTAQDKWNLLPAFLKVKGLIKQHIDSFNYFTEVQLKKIVGAPGNRMVKSDVNEQFWMEYVA